MARLTTTSGAEREARRQNSVVLPIALGMLVLGGIVATFVARACG